MIERLTELGYLDDADYARRKAELLARRGYGDRQIFYRLSQLQIPENRIDQAMLQITLSEADRVRMVVEKRKGKEREKLIRYLNSRGFALDMILEVLNGDII